MSIRNPYDTAQQRAVPSELYRADVAGHRVYATPRRRSVQIGVFLPSEPPETGVRRLAERHLL